MVNIKTRRNITQIIGIAIITLLAFNAIPRAATADEVAYKMGPGDQLNITVQGHPDVSEEVTVQSDGRISLPLLGRISVNGRIPADIEYELLSLLREKGINTRGVSLQVTIYRAFYVLGDVAQPGSYAFRPNLTAIRAVALAGGRYRPIGQRNSATASTLRIREELEVLRHRIVNLTLRKIRFLRVSERAKTFDVSGPEISTAVDAGDLQALIERNRELFLQNAKMFTSQQQGRRQEAKVFEQELAALNRQRKAMLAELVIIRDQHSKLSGLLAKGLTTQAKVSDLKREELSALINLSNIDALEARAKQNLVDAHNRLNTAIAQRHTTSLHSLIETEEELSEAIIRERRVRQILESYTGESAGSDKQLTTSVARLVFDISRSDGQLMKNAPPTTPIIPGDVIEVLDVLGKEK